MSQRPHQEPDPRPATAGDPGRAPAPAAPASVPPGPVPADPKARVSPPPLEANDRLVTAVFTGGWVIALVVLLIVRTDIRPSERWWIWVAVAGVAMGLFALFYVPHLQRSRAQTAQRRATHPTNTPT